MSLLSDRSTVVTGAMRGNGRAIAERFAEHGADVVVADAREEPREASVPRQELIEDETDAQARYVNCDVTEKSDLMAAMDAADGYTAPT